VNLTLEIIFGWLLWSIFGRLFHPILVRFYGQFGSILAGFLAQSGRQSDRSQKFGHLEILKNGEIFGSFEMIF
jgi:hypothetical protein